MSIKLKARQKLNDSSFSIVYVFIKPKTRQNLMIDLLVLKMSLSNQKPANPLMISHSVLSMHLLKQIALFSFNTFTLGNKYAFVNLLFKFSAHLTFAVHNDLQ